MVVSIAFLYAVTSSSPSAVVSFMRFRDARLQAESSRNMYSEHGLLALMREVFGHGCQSLTVVSNCMPGSPHTQVASEIIRTRSRALLVSTGFVLATPRVW